MSELPDGWIMAPLEDLGNWGSGGTPKKTNPRFYVNGTIPWLVIGDLNDGVVTYAQTHITEEGLFNSSAQLLPPKTLLVAMYGSIGKLGITGITCATNQAIAFCSTYQEVIELRYLFHALKNSRDTLVAKGKGGAQQNISQTILKAHQIPLAPLNEQKRIADKLDVMLARVDACKERLKRIPPILKRFRQAVLAAATSGQLTEDWRTKHFKESGSNNHKISGKLVDFADVIDPNPSHRYPSYESGTIPLLATEQMSGLDSWNISSAKLTTSKFYEARKASHDFLNDDIIFARKGRLGLARNPPQNSCYVFSHTVFIIRAKVGKILPAYLLWFLRQEWCIEWLLLEMNSNAGVPTLGKSVMERLPVQIPSYIEQEEIVRRIENLFVYSDRLEARYQAARTKIERLTPVLLAKAFRGELVPQDPNDEPASSLLERIRAERAAQPAKAKKAMTPRKPAMTKMTKESVKEVIRQLPKDKFSFDELRENLTGDYDSLKDILFTLLSEADPVLTQVFDQEERAMCFFRAGK
ncbi:MAG: type I restriction endonuclease subunit S [Nostoc sp. GBBB01]|nr:type I restriction endonuclease subunit S [Nostoc sp. GBBB01]